MKAGKLVSGGAVALLVLSGSVVGTAMPANAAAAGCTVGRYMTPPTKIYNGGVAQCEILNGGTRVRAAVHCRGFGTYWVYGPWVSRPNTLSKGICRSLQDDAYEVDYQLG